MSYPVLASVSRRYPRLWDRLLTCYSPVRHSRIATCVRLACIRHAASVYPEPGSNSPWSLFLVFSTSSFFLCLLFVSVICSVFKDPVYQHVTFSRAFSLYHKSMVVSTIFNRKKRTFSRKKKRLLSQLFTKLISFFSKPTNRPVIREKKWSISLVRYAWWIILVGYWYAFFRLYFAVVRLSGCSPLYDSLLCLI